MQDTTRVTAATMVRRDFAGLAILALLGILALSALALTQLLASSAAVAHAQAVTPPATDDTVPPAPPPDAAAPIRATLFLQVVDPEDADVEVALETATITISGLAAPGAVVSIDGTLADVADDGTFSASVGLEEGANEISVVASDADGNQVAQTLFVVRG